jgi:hypothetical protein
MTITNPRTAAAAKPYRNSSLTRQRCASGLLSFLSLFTSFGTLLCCALPSLLVLLGLGATVASLLSAAPWLVSLSHHKTLGRDLRRWGV